MGIAGELGNSIKGRGKKHNVLKPIQDPVVHNSVTATDHMVEDVIILIEVIVYWAR